jgi:hypothetical protein
MTREEAQARCAQLNADPDRERQWFARQVAPQEWEVVSVAAPDGIRLGPLTATTEAKPRPAQAPDPRPSLFRNIPPYGAG